MLLKMEIVQKKEYIQKLSEKNKIMKILNS